jgi:hypothetical protein
MWWRQLMAKDIEEGVSLDVGGVCSDFAAIS